LLALADEHGQLTDAGVEFGVVFRFEGDADVPGPKGGRFMSLHTYPSTLPPNGARFVRSIRSSRLAGDTVIMETLDSLLASFAGWEP
jgi:hypothetical protein